MKTIIYTALLFTFYTFFSCKQTAEEKTQDFAVNSNEIQIKDTIPKVYVVGDEQNINTKNYMAKIWIDGVGQNLTDGKVHAMASAVFVTENRDVYVVGKEEKQDNLTSSKNKWVAKLWKNGVGIDLTDGINNAGANDVFVWGDDVYVVGSEADKDERPIAKLWKNGKSQNLDGNASYAYSVFVYEGNVYVAGKGNGAVWWKNGIKQNLISESYTHSDAFSVFVKDGNVYLAGHYSNMPTVWEDSKKQILDVEFPEAFASSVFVSENNDIYVTGIGGHRYDKGNTFARLWKNGVVTDLTKGKSAAYAASVHVYGNDVYVVGAEDMHAKIWKNGIISNLTDEKSTSSANDVFVK